MITNAKLFGLAEAQRMAEDRENWEAVYQDWLFNTPPDTYPLESDELQEIEDIIAEMNQRPATQLLSWCGGCGQIYDSRNGEPLCGPCNRAEEQAWTDYQEDVVVALAATNGTL